MRGYERIDTDSGGYTSEGCGYLWKQRTIFERIDTDSGGYLWKQRTMNPMEIQTMDSDTGPGPCGFADASIDEKIERLRAAIFDLANTFSTAFKQVNEDVSRLESEIMDK